MSEGIYHRLLVIFLNYHDESFYAGELIKNIQRAVPEAKASTVYTGLHKYEKKGFIRKYKKLGFPYFKYTLKDEEGARAFIEDVPSRTLSPTASYRPSELKEIDHHNFFNVHLTQEQFNRIERHLSKPKPRDRSQNRAFATKTFSLSISERTLNGVFYILDYKRYFADAERWLGTDFVDDLVTKPEFLGKSIDLDHLIGQKISHKDFKILFARSHYIRELDAEGKAIYIRSYARNLFMDAAERTIFQADLLGMLETLLDVQQEERKDNKEWRAELTHLLKSQKEMQEDINVIGEAVKEMFKEFVKKPEKPQEPKELSEHDKIMFG